MRKWGVILTVILLSFIAFSGCGTKPETPSKVQAKSSSRTVTIGHIAMNGSSPQALINREKKLFEKAFQEAGYKGVEWVITRGRDNVGPMMEEGKFDFVYTPINNFTAYFTETSQFAAGDNYRIIAGSLATPEGSILLVNKGISDISDLDGKVIGIVNNSYSTEMLFNLQLADAGLATDTVGGTVHIEFQDYLVKFYEAFEQGKFDGIIIRRSEEKRLLERFPNAKRLFSLNDGNKAGALIPSVWLYGRADVLENEPELVNLMLKTHIEATAVAEKNKDMLPRLAEDTMDYYYKEIIKAEGYEKDPIEDMIKEWERFHITYDPNAEYAQKLHKFIVDAGYTDKPLEKFANFAPLKAILEKQQ